MEQPNNYEQSPSSSLLQAKANWKYRIPPFPNYKRSTQIVPIVREALKDRWYFDNPWMVKNTSPNTGLMDL
jgi:hypothetical protein